jgi:hypothetical protein
MAFRTAGLTTMAEFLGDRVIYRNLVPADERIPPLAELRKALDLESDTIPRKVEPAYGHVVAEMLRRGREVDHPGATIQRLVFIGDTPLNDGTAFRNICAAGDWPGWAFIARDALDVPAQAEIEDRLYLANRWSALPDFLQFVEGQGFPLDEGTGVIVDMDKTAIGARGRNDRVINEARVEGVQRTVADLLGSGFDQGAFRSAYDELNQSPYYGLTADNQDYLAYICLMLGVGLFDLSGLVAEVQAGSMNGFSQFISRVQDRRSELAGTGLTSIHEDVWRCVQAGDPTPFKAFRYNEYLTTVARFGDVPGAAAEQLLSQRIVITEEVRQAAVALLGRGALLFAVSDKPDEASVPSEAQANSGMVALHHLPTVAVAMS